MGKAKGDSSRSKTRPSSSSLAASLAQTSGTGSLGFGGYVGSARVEPVPGSDGDTLVDVDVEAALLLRRLSKKDPTTKLKTLSALRNFFKEHPGSGLATLMPPWVFEYKRLVQDSSRQVRESAHEAMSDLATAIGRGLAPHLRALMGAWWVSQFDPSKEVAEAAQHSLQLAFPNQTKRVDALIYSINEIFTYLDENLKLTPQTISDKSSSIGESTEKYERVISSSLLATAAILDVLISPVKSSSNTVAANGTAADSSRTNKASITDRASRLCLNHKFFQGFVKSGVPGIRSATYQVFRAFIQHVPGLFATADQDMVVGVILGSFAEKSAICHQPMWEMVLLFARTFPEAWQVVTIRKVVLPRLWGFLKHGCYGSQQISRQYLLVLLSLVPPVAVNPSQVFFHDFFSSLWQGVLSGSLSPVDKQALLQVLQECLIWVVTNIARYTDEDEKGAKELQQYLIELVLFKFIWSQYVNNGITRHDQEHGEQLAVSSRENTRQGHLEKSDVIVLLPEQFNRELATCFVDLLAYFVEKDSGLVKALWPEFHSSCTSTFQSVANRSQTGDKDLCLSRLSDFFVLLAAKRSSCKPSTQIWALTHVVRPIITQVYSEIMASGHSEAVKVLAKVATIYGPDAFYGLWCKGSGDDSIDVVEHRDTSFLQELMWWCLDGNPDVGSKIELLLAYVEWKNFEEEWSNILLYVSSLQQSQEEEVSLEARQIETLTVLVQSIRQKVNKLAVSGEVEAANLLLDKSRSKVLDKVIVSVARSADIVNPSHLQLIRYVLESRETPTLMVSTPVATSILTRLLNKLLTVLRHANYKWAIQASSLISSTPVESCEHDEMDETCTGDDMWVQAKDALDIIGECIGALSTTDIKISANIAATIYCLKWAHTNHVQNAGIEFEEYESDVDAADEDNFVDSSERNCVKITSANEAADSVSEVGMETRIGFLESLKVITDKVSQPFHEKLTALSKSHLRWILTRCIRFAIFVKDDEEGHQLIRRSASWALELSENFSQNAEDLDETMELLLASNDSWPWWTDGSCQKPGSMSVLRSAGKQDADQENAHRQFASFVDSLPPALVYFSHSVQSAKLQQEVRPENVACPGPEITLGKQVYLAKKPCRVWLALELLCTWQWPNGGAMQSVVPFLKQCGQAAVGTVERELCDMTVCSLFQGVSAIAKIESSESFGLLWDTGEDEIHNFGCAPLRALLLLLRSLLERGGHDAKVDAYAIFSEHVLQDRPGNLSVGENLKVLPLVLSVLMPVLRKRISEEPRLKENILESDEGWSREVELSVSEWLATALRRPPLVASERGVQDTLFWIRLVVSCFPLNPSGGVATMVAASASVVSVQERELLLALLRKQSSREARAAVAAHAAILRAAPIQEDLKPDPLWKQDVELGLAKLVAVTVAYCWKSFSQDDWEFVLSRLRKWLEAAVLMFEEFAESVVEAIPESKDALGMVLPLAVEGNSASKLFTIAISVVSLVKALTDFEGAIGTDSWEQLKQANWEMADTRAMADILRLLLATGMAEAAAAASSDGNRARSVVVSWRKGDTSLWDSISDVAVSSSGRTREAAVRAADLWGTGITSISALYALLFSPEPIDSLQWTAYQFLSSEPLEQLSVSKGVVSADHGGLTDEGEEGGAGSGDDGSPPQDVPPIRQELSSLLETPWAVIQSSPLTSSLRVRYFLSWSLFLTRLQNLPPLSRARERLVQYAQDLDIASRLLDCLFQHIPLERTSSVSRKASSAGPKLSGPATAARRATSTGSVAFAVEGLWPVGKEEMASLAGAIYGLLLRVLRACVRIWFTGVHNRGLVTAIEVFTTTHCSPELLAEEFSQVQASAVAEETLSIKANRSTREVTAFYKKEEAGMDILIRLPASYPLRAPEVEWTRRMGISETRARKWLLSIATFLRNQNGAVSEAVQIWKRNVDREFEGVEECPICYSIIHTSNHCLPRLPCKTCKHKFHSACLYKWFDTSHKSTCPLCQSPFLTP